MNQNVPVVDVVIPVYNRDRLLLESIQSVLNQSYENLQIFIIEDGSNLANKYASSFSGNVSNRDEYSRNKYSEFPNHKRVAFVRLFENRGVSYCRNFGASLGQGKYIAFLDSDDLWENSKISKQVEFLESHSEYQWIHTNELWEKNRTIINQKKEHKKQGGRFMNRLLKRCLISPSSVLFKRDFFEYKGWFLQHFPVAEDYELWLRLNLKNPIAYLDEPLTIKRAGDWDQLSRTPEIDKWRVLALHRLYRHNKNDPEFLELQTLWKNELLKKTRILIKGAEKYQHPEKLSKYQNWLNVFNTF